MDVMPREGSFALASLGSVRKLQAGGLVVVAGLKSVAVKRILEAVVVSLMARGVRGPLAREMPVVFGLAMLFAIIGSFLACRGAAYTKTLKAG
jgi:hypothetical protein